MVNDAEQVNAPKKQPNSTHCFGCGLENTNGLGMTFYELEPGHVTSDVTIAEQFQGYPGVVHGGIVATILDEVANRVLVAGDHSRMMMTAKLVTRYRRPVPVGKPLRVEGWLIRDRGRYATTRSEIHLEDGTVAAEAEATLASIQTSESIKGELEDMGWRIYPD